MAYLLNCAQCGRPAELAKPTARFCSSACRNRRYYADLTARRLRLATQAAAALRSGDVAELERVARRTVELLAP